MAGETGHHHSQHEVKPRCSLRNIDQAAGREVARTVLSRGFLTSRWIFANAQPSLQSDVMLSTIRGLAKFIHLAKEELNKPVDYFRNVTHRVILATDSLNLRLDAALRDREENINLHYVVSNVRRPRTSQLPKTKGANTKEPVNITSPCWLQRVCLVLITS